jgi:hypothetical protein
MGKNENINKQNYRSSTNVEDSVKKRDAKKGHKKAPAT